MSAVVEAAIENIRDTLAIALEHTHSQTALVIADERSELSRLLTQAYRACLPDARCSRSTPLERSRSKRHLKNSASTIWWS